MVADRVDLSKPTPLHSDSSSSGSSSSSSDDSDEGTSDTDSDSDKEVAKKKRWVLFMQLILYMLLMIAEKQMTFWGVVCF